MVTFLSQILIAPERAVQLPGKVGKGFRTDGDDHLALLFAERKGFAKVAFLQGIVRVLQQHLAELAVDHCGGKNTAQPVRVLDRRNIQLNLRLVADE